MFRDLIEAFATGVIAYVIFNFVKGFLLSQLPTLPFDLMSAIIFGILVLILDFLIRGLVEQTTRF